jgi:uncharacterized membrane protein YhhN
VRTARWVLIAAIVAGASYLVGETLQIPLALSIIWKGAGVGLLAVYAALRARTADGWLLAALMACGAAGDVLLETSGLIVGAVAFLGEHLLALLLYLRNLRSPLKPQDRLVTFLLPPATVLLAFALPADRIAAPAAAVYAVGLGAMAASAWISRFPRALTGLGALMFLASDMLIFLRTGRPFAHETWMGWAVWSLYFAGQLLIVLGVVRGLARPPAQAESLAA